MRIALVSPLPPARTGIADYAEALAGAMRDRAELDLISAPSLDFDPSRYEQILYHLGNNPYHSFVYEYALRSPGVAVLHEPNLHHLLAHLTIGRGDWEAYLREVEYEAGEPALAHARRVQAGEAAPDYAGVPMLRRLLERSRAVVVHSRYAEQQVRAGGFTGPLAVIPHGAWTPLVDRMAYRHKLGLDGTTPLIGIFGFLKPYKRIAESLRAFRRVLRLEPRARLILAGEPHPDVPVSRWVRESGLLGSVKVTGFLPPEDLPGCMATCDIVLNLRYPTVGETSGTLMRALGLGRAALVSDVGAFRELPDEICLKVPVDEKEEEVLFEFLNLLLCRPELARAMGATAKEWAERECSWDRVASLYIEFLQDLEQGKPTHPPARLAASPQPQAPPTKPAAEDLLDWAPAEPAPREYMETHFNRLEKILEITPPGGPQDRILEMGAYLQITPLLKSRLGYGEVRGCYWGPCGERSIRQAVSGGGRRFECRIDFFDAASDPFPYPDGHFATVLCCEVLEHLPRDPMHMMAEIHRVLRPGGHLVLTTPNLTSLRAVAAVLEGYHPGLQSSYLPPELESQESRHHREYTPHEIRWLLHDAGFEVTLLATGPYREAPRPELAWVARLLEHFGLPVELRGEAIYAVGRKAGPLRRRYPEWLYGGRMA